MTQQSFLTQHTFLLQKKIADIFGFEYDFVKEKLDAYVPESNKFIDHAYFSANIILKKLTEDGSSLSTDIAVDTAVSILLHSGFWRYGVGKGKKLSVATHPLTFLLNLCDELQVFDRIGYGQTSKSEPLPRNMYLDYEDENYNFVLAFGNNALCYKPNGKDIQLDFIAKSRDKVNKILAELFDFDGFGNVIVSVVINNDKKTRAFHNSVSFFKYILEIAMQIQNNYRNTQTYNSLEGEWNDQTLEIKMSNILCAKGYAEKLSLIGCFYDEKELLLEKLDVLTEEQIEFLAQVEHQRWSIEKLSMGWVFEDYDATNPVMRKQKRAERKHNCLCTYDELSYEDKLKDVAVVKNMIMNLSTKYDGNKTGLYVYRVAKQKKIDDTLYVGITGHKVLKNPYEVECGIKSVLLKIRNEKDKKIVLLNALADGFDFLAAKVAMEFGFEIQAIFPEKFTDYFCEVQDKSLFQDILQYKKLSMIFLPNFNPNIYMDLSTYISTNCDYLLAGWDRKITEKLGGTYFTLKLAEKANKKIEIVFCER